MRNPFQAWRISSDMMRRKMIFIALAGCFAISARAQTFDTSGNGLLNGDYFVRELALIVNTSGALAQAFNASGTISFDGNGNYTFNGQILDSNVGTPQNASFSGTYSVESNGLAQVQSLLESGQNIFGAVTQSVFSGSSTESNQVNDILIAIPAGSSASNASLQGPYTVGAIEFLQSNGTPRDSYFTLNGDGNGKFSQIKVNGSAADMGDSLLTQTISGATYSISGNGSGTANFPAAVSGGTDNQLFTGSKILYVSFDGTIVLGGGANTFDIFVGIRPTSLPANNATFKSTYFLAGMEDIAPDVSAGTDNINTYAGSVNPFGNGAAVSHLRINNISSAGAQIYDYTYSLGYDFASDGTDTQDFLHYALGLEGDGVVIVGRGSEYQLTFGLKAPSFSGPGVYLNPIGIVNAASMAPITNSVAPGEYLTLYGTGLANSTKRAKTAPFPKQLGGVQVKINGRAAPIYYVSPGQISVLVPYATAEPYATFQVINNGTPSNEVTLYTNTTSPAVFSLDESGYGPGAVLRQNNTVISSSNPAHIGETIQIFLTGLGAVSPVVNDGALSPSNPPATTTAQVQVTVDGVNASVKFEGLAPQAVGLYQVNVKIPAGVRSGDVFLDISTPGALTSQVTIAIAP
jgi:uncharacterized protein (TIGR03437 family)